jgi:hypothetical protein
VPWGSEFFEEFLCRVADGGRCRIQTLSETYPVHILMLSAASQVQVVRPIRADIRRPCGGVADGSEIFANSSRI